MSENNFKILGIEHIGVATNNNLLNNFFKNILGITDIYVEEVKDQHVVTEIFDTGNGKIELLKATSETSPISNFLQNRGPSVHHIALCVDNLQNAITALKNKNIKLIDEKPRVGAEGYPVAFIHPDESPGILVELCQKNK